jgi:hypothetical protein
MFSIPRHPILVFCLDDFGVDALRFINHLKSYFYKLEWDDYLCRQQQLEYILENIFHNQTISDDMNRLFCAYYKGDLNKAALQQWIHILNEEQKVTFYRIEPTRRRAMQSFEVTVQTSELSITPTDKKNFTQPQALSLKNHTDWRTLERFFPSPPSGMISEDIYLIVAQLAKRILYYHPTITSMTVCVHFTQIIATPNTTATNSPEGIHQDGMDYIVSALVIDRENVSGGKSIIFSTNDSCKVLFETTLRPGHGIFQPDKGTDLWHVVEPITAFDRTRSAYRSTIGFDFELHNHVQGEIEEV